MPKRSKQTAVQSDQNKLGTFAGVFTPSILTILGIILFLRLGYLVGSGGLLQTLLIILIAYTITILTSISLSAIATNLKVRGGGDYYLISRTLGIEFGGALGLVLFFAQSISIGFYCIGFGEVVAGMFPIAHGMAQIIALAAIAVLFFLAWRGADWATRFQYAVMTILCLALISFFIGGLQHWDSTLLQENLLSRSESPPFWLLFALFFPAVTGFTQGVSMSGDLRSPSQSLPRGTFLAVSISLLIYLLAALFFAASLPQPLLVSDYSAMNRVAWLPNFIFAGVCAATLSSAMASFLGAPRILQSLASDKIFPLLTPFAKGAGLSNNPQRGVLLAAAIALLTVALGNLNLIASIVAMFFLISYGLLNYATYFEARSASPSFRPRFKWFHKYASLAGAIICLLAMLAINWESGALAVALIFGLYQYLQRTVKQSRWADGRRSYHLQQVREHLLQISLELEHPRDWRPQILAFSSSKERRERLLKFSSWLVAGSGLTTLVHILEKRKSEKVAAENELYEDIAASGVQAFPLVVNAPSLAIGSELLLQSFGVGPLKANTILINYLGTYAQHFFSQQLKSFGKNLHAALRLGYNIVILDAKEDEWHQLELQPADQRRIDIWYIPGNSGSLMLLQAHLITRAPFWDQADLRVLSAPHGNNKGALQALQDELEESRIDAQAMIVKDFSRATIRHYSKDASLVLLPLTLQAEQLVDCSGLPVADLLAELPLVALVIAVQKIDLDAEPEQGIAGLLAEAQDKLNAAHTSAKQAEEEVKNENIAIEASLKALLKTPLHGDDEDRNTIYAQLAKIRQKLDSATRRSAKAETKQELYKQQLERLQKQCHLTNGDIKKTANGEDNKES
ncbi:amino acid permease [Psychromonas antarctica]|uniref:amino acid permease n=1 Tax=Psychromonas antarctica TaxID=67573 RepID=UPI001EE904D4|nr:amino acid permease [Psychromonas antarctica]MCG6199971.1 amino acid permease [Psychromonas antarctica]